MKNNIRNKIRNPFLYFLKSEASSGIILLICAVIAIIIANSKLASEYEHFFALANSGVAIELGKFSSLVFTPVSLGIICGLFIGKQAGIFSVSYLLIKLKVAKLPAMVTLAHLYGASVLGGIGFTMSLFVASLSFSDPASLATAKLSIILASLLSGITGVVVFKMLAPKTL